MIVYLAHPVAPTQEQILQSISGGELWPPSASHEEYIVEMNLQSARSWLRWPVTSTDWAVSMPWMPYVQALGEDGGAMRARGLRDDCLMASRCDAIVLCGGRISSGMAMERDAVQKAGKAVVSLIDLGELPPAGDHKDMLARRLREALGG